MAAPCYPIIYVRGFAMTQGDIDETTADPFCGFNLGSTVFRATVDKDKASRKFVFESPVLRLGSDYGYKDIFENGLDILDDGWQGKILNRSIIIDRYYDQASTLLGDGKVPSMLQCGQGLNDLILRIRENYYGDDPNGQPIPDKFRCYLVAHSMGGLICRVLLQNSVFSTSPARKSVEKFFTYATPHNGIEVAGINVPHWLSACDISNFNRDNMADYLDLQKLPAYKSTDRVDWIPESCFPSRKIFCMVGTNQADYSVAMGLSRTFVGHGSDGLVKIDNAAVWGVGDDGTTVSAPCATAYAYRSHSGFFGIVNSEESYQNLVRFLFGEVRIDVWFDVDAVRLPPQLQTQAADVDAVYQFEIAAAPKAKPWFLTRRMAMEDSVACRSLSELNNQKPMGVSGDRSKIYLSTIFLDSRWRSDPANPSMRYALNLNICAPNYEVEHKLWFDSHYEGGYLFQDWLVMEIIPSPGPLPAWQVRYDWQSENRGDPTKTPGVNALKNGDIELTVDVDDKLTPGITGKLRFVVSPWNQA